MDQAQFIGYMILAGITIFSFYKGLAAFTKPINELKIVIQKLNDCIEHLMKDNENQNKRIEKHGQEIDDLKDRVGKVETKINIYHKGEH